MSVGLRAVSAGFPGVPVLHEVSLHVSDGEVLSVFGPSGSGKTTLLRVLAGLHRPASGRVLVDDADVTRTRVERRGIGLVPQEGALFPHRSVAGNIGYGVPRGARAGRVAELLDLIGLPDAGRSMPHELSGGQRQRVALARALAARPRALLLDEPFSSLDASLRLSLGSETVDILRSSGTASVLITHDVAEALSLSDRIVVLDAGRVLAEGTPAELYDRPPGERVARMFGPALVVPAEPAGAGVRTGLGEHATTEGRAPSGPARAMIRPEGLSLVQPGSPDAVPGDVEQVAYHGGLSTVTVLTAAVGRVTIRVESPTPVRVGDAVAVRVHAPVHVLGPEAAVNGTGASGA